MVMTLRNINKYAKPNEPENYIETWETIYLGNLKFGYADGAFLISWNFYFKAINAIHLLYTSLGSSSNNQIMTQSNIIQIVSSKIQRTSQHMHFNRSDTRIYFEETVFSN